MVSATFRPTSDSRTSTTPTSSAAFPRSTPRSAPRAARTRPCSPSRPGCCDAMLKARVDRPRCIGAGNCITIAPTAFDWVEGDYGKAEVLEVTTVEEEQLREAALSCPTQAIVIEEVDELLPWQLRSRTQTQRVQRTFMFTDIVGSTNLLEAMGDEAWQSLLDWHDRMLRSMFSENRGEEITAIGDGFFVAFEAPDDALACAVAIQRGLAEHRKTAGSAPQVRIGVHASDATRVGRNFTGKGVHEAARIGALAEGSEILASVDTATGGRYPMSDSKAVTVKGIADPIDVVTV